MKINSKILSKPKLLLLIAIILNSLNIYCQGNENFETEKLKQKFYYVSEEKISEFIKVSTELQIQFKEYDDKITVIKNNKKCILTKDIIETIAVEKKGDVIEKISNSVAKWRVYYKTQSKIAVSLAKHIKAYKSRLMTKPRLIIWQKETKECLSIQEKMNNLPFANSSDFYNQLETEENQVHSGILDIMNASKNFTGI